MGLSCDNIAARLNHEVAEEKSVLFSRRPESEVEPSTFLSNGLIPPSFR
jgi:hypothetical protein